VLFFQLNNIYNKTSFISLRLERKKWKHGRYHGHMIYIIFKSKTLIESS
jgi:hypothetical protein